MGNSLVSRAGRIWVAASLSLVLCLSQAVAHVGGASGLALRAAPAHARNVWVGRFGWSHGGWAWRGRNGWTWRRQYGWNGWNRRNGWGRNGSYGNQAGYFDGFGYWPWGYGYADAAPASNGGDAPSIIVIGPPANAYPVPLPAAFERGPESACVIHKLEYDRAGKYTGEKQFPQC